MTPCPDHEVLTGFIERQLPEPQRAEIERHVAGCGSCLDVVAAAAIPAEQTPALTPPARPVRLAAPAPTSRRPASYALAAGLALLVTAGIGYLGMGVVTEQARLAAVRMATEQLGLSVDVESLGMAVAGDLRAIRVTARQLDLGAFGRAVAAEFEIAPGDLAFGAPTLRAIRLFAPEFRWTLEEDDPERLRLADALGAFALAPAIEIHDAVLHVNQPNGPPIVVEHLSATAHTVDGRVRVRATGTLGDGTLSIRGSIDTDDEPRVDVTIGGWDLPSAVLPYVRDWMDGRLTMALRVTGATSNPRWAGRLRIADARLLGLDPLRDLAASFWLKQAALSTSRNQAAGVRATVRIDQDGWRVPRGRIVQGELETRMVVKGTPDAGVTGEGVALLSEAPAAALIARSPLFRLYGTRTGRLRIPFALQGVPGKVTIVRK